ncbi:MAG: prolyl aminopeptidase [Rhodospirillaceae bacterium]|nr:prolyl aminopeptidase [Rhodospirillaceae bacterium]
MDATHKSPDLYPPIAPFANGMLDTGDGHQIYWEQSGNPDGEPILFVHGGPGAGCGPQHRRFFNPRHYHIVLFDQRGAGKSTPFASVTENTTGHLVDDMERLRRHLGIERWTLFGGSWGSTLSLVYAIRYPDRCRAIVLRGVFLGGAHELEWFVNGIANIFPEVHRQFVDFLPADERADPVRAYYARLIDPDPDRHLAAAVSWARYETVCSTLLPGGAATRPPPERNSRPKDADSVLPLSRIEAHFFINGMFLEEGYIIENVHKLAALPVIIVHGRYDIICPIITADKLHRALLHAGAKSRLDIIDDAGHSAMEPGIRKALVQATDDLRGL